MGFAFVVGKCFGCGGIFSFNASYVPSIRHLGEKEPVCRVCMDRANANRVEMGLEPHSIHPEAYEPEEVL